MTFKKADDREDFKFIKKGPKIQASESLTLKVSKRISDGFEDSEKHNSPHKKQRRVNSNNDTRLGSLELTQKGTFTQKLQGSTWRRGQKKTRTATIASLWAGRQYLGNSQIKSGSHDPLDSFEEETEPHSEVQTKSHRQKAPHSNIDELNDADEDVDLLAFPPDDIDDDDIGVGMTNRDVDEVDLLVEPDELGDEQTQVASDNDEDVDLIIPNTDTPEPEQNVALGGRTGF